MLESSNTDALDRIQELEAALRERDERLLNKDAQIEAREQRIRLLEEALRYLKADKYGASREKLGEVPGQRGLFNEVETIEELMQAVGVEVPLTATPVAREQGLEHEARPQSPGEPSAPHRSAA